MQGIPLGARSAGRRRSADEIGSILSRQRRSGLSLLAFARKQGLCYATLRRWHAVYGDAGVATTAGQGGSGRGRPQEGGAAFVAVALEPEARPGDFILDWAPGRSLRIAAGFDPGQLRRLLEVLGVLP